MVAGAQGRACGCCWRLCVCRPGTLGRCTPQRRALHARLSGSFGRCWSCPPGGRPGLGLTLRGPCQTALANSTLVEVCVNAAGPFLSLTTSLNCTTGMARGPGIHT